MIAKPLPWAKRLAERAPSLQRLNIGPRLTLCFVSIIVAMLAGNAVLLWQFHQARRQAELLAGVDQELIVVLQAHTNLMSFYEKLDVLADSEDTTLLLEQLETLHNALFRSSERGRNALTHLPPEVPLDPTLLPTLLAIHRELPAQLEAITILAKAEDWDAVRLRLTNQVRPLESRSSALVENIDREVSEQRMQAVLDIRQAQRRILLIVSITAAVTLIFAGMLGLAITRSITRPLGRLVEGSTALARGDFSHRVETTGSDEITRLGSVFNDTIVRLQELYRELQSRETYLAEAQKLSHTGSFGWNIENGEIYWSAETFRIFEFEPKARVTVDSILARTHPEDRSALQQVIERMSREGSPFDVEHRLLMPDGTVKCLRVVGHPSIEEGNHHEFVGAVTDVTEQKRAEEAVQRSERELRDVIESIPTFAWTAQPDGSVDFANRSWREYTGLSEEETTGSGWQAAVHLEDLEQHAKKWRAALATSALFEHEMRYRRARDGQYRWFLTRAVPFRDAQGRILKWYGISTDIEDRRRAEGLLAWEKRVLEMVAKGDSLAEILDVLCRGVEEHAPGALASILLSDGVRLRHGSAPNLRRTYTNAIDGVEIGPSAGSCGTAAYRGNAVVVEDIATDPLWAKYRDLALSHGLRACWSTPVFSSRGKVIATFAMYYREPRSPAPREQEITEQITHLAGVAIERKLIQEALRRNEAYLAEAQRLTHTGSWAFNPTVARMVYWSEETFRIFGLNPRESGPTLEQYRQSIHHEDRDRVMQFRDQNFAEKSEYVDDFRAVMPDGSVKHLHVIGHPVLDESGAVLEYVGTVVDITERKRAEEERERLHQLEIDLAHIHRVSMMGELAASLAHEIKQPITAAATNAATCLRWLQREPPEIGEAHETAARVVRDVTRAAEIINRMRSLYTKGLKQRELVDVNEVVGEMTVLLHNEACRYSILIRNDLANNLPKAIADRVQLQQALMNLMLNGIEAMRDTGGELMIKSARTADGQLWISVRDTGVGLPGEVGDQIFSAFFTTKSQGTGMGLAITRSIVEAHGGRLWAESNYGPGATFHFTLSA